MLVFAVLCRVELVGLRGVELNLVGILVRILDPNAVCGARSDVYCGVDLGANFRAQQVEHIRCRCTLIEQ